MGRDGMVWERDGTVPERNGAVLERDGIKNMNRPTCK